MKGGVCGSTGLLLALLAASCQLSEPTLSSSHSCAPTPRQGFGLRLRQGDGVFAALREGKGGLILQARGKGGKDVALVATGRAEERPKSGPLAWGMGMFAEGPKSAKMRLTMAVNAVNEAQATIGSGFRSICGKVYDTRNHLYAGAIARIVAISIMFPVDTIKTRLQIHGADCCTPLQWREAIRWPIYPGVGSSLLGQVPNAMLVYGSYELYKKELSLAFPKLNVTQVRFAAAMLGDITGSVWLSPFEGTKQRVQAGSYSGVREALSGVLRKEGVRGLYRGYSAQVLRDLAYHAIQLPLYEGVREMWLKRRGREGNLEPFESMVCGAIAGAVSGALTTPIDVIKTRLMTVKGSQRTIQGVFVDILAREGPVGLAAGLRERALYIALGSAIFWGCFE
eukprot:CAMPEP_0172070490 /NCGR_PEP_ID=MMETSP1043-20130122/13289_1 /TAXON_ID=464988 /ORGANISM="Hemiselmis andersenii, Strain CCMP441" /LENGTH=395 /DNA_ID=CAMNT_0012730853 /DNA_START=35 /DNA_END=1219 /DNA_ORIENTATION=-